MKRYARGILLNEKNAISYRCGATIEAIFCNIEDCVVQKSYTEFNEKKSLSNSQKFDIFSPGHWNQESLHDRVDSFRSDLNRLIIYNWLESLLYNNGIFFNSSETEIWVETWSKRCILAVCWKLIISRQLLNRFHCFFTRNRIKLFAVPFRRTGTGYVVCRVQDLSGTRFVRYVVCRVRSWYGSL